MGWVPAAAGTDHHGLGPTSGCREAGLFLRRPGSLPCPPPGPGGSRHPPHHRAFPSAPGVSAKKRVIRFRAQPSNPGCALSRRTLSYTRGHPSSKPVTHTGSRMCHAHRGLATRHALHGFTPRDPEVAWLTYERVRDVLAGSQGRACGVPGERQRQSRKALFLGFPAGNQSRDAGTCHTGTAFGAILVLGAGLSPTGPISSQGGACVGARPPSSPWGIQQVIGPLVPMGFASHL